MIIDVQNLFINLFFYYFLNIYIISLNLLKIITFNRFIKHFKYINKNRNINLFFLSKKFHIKVMISKTLFKI